MLNNDGNKKGEAIVCAGSELIHETHLRYRIFLTSRTRRIMKYSEIPSRATSHLHSSFEQLQLMTDLCQGYPQVPPSPITCFPLSLFLRHPHQDVNFTYTPMPALMRHHLTLHFPAPRASFKFATAGHLSDLP